MNKPKNICKFFLQVLPFLQSFGIIIQDTVADPEADPLRMKQSPQGTPPTYRKEKLLWHGMKVWKL